MLAISCPYLFVSQRKSRVRPELRNQPSASPVGATVTTIGLIGSGNVGGAVARLSVAAGHKVVLSNSRSPETLTNLANELGPLATTGTGEEAARASDLMLISVPLRAYQSVPVRPLADKIVMDAGNYYPQRDGQFAELDEGSATSSGLLQRHLPTSRVVKVFNNIYFKYLLSLARPHDAADRSALPIAGDDAAAKAAVTAFLDSIGYDAVDDGVLADSWRQEPGSPVYAVPYGSVPSRRTRYGLAAEEQGTPAGAAAIRAALAAARR